MLLGGALVGYGARLGNGCTSGHGICGLGSLQLPSLGAVLTFMATAFMTANLLAHSDLFRAGIARSGAYNRTLTPFGFQAERRPYWQAKDIYLKLSPFT